MRGGKRPGAGRKKGSVSKETMLRKQIAEQALASGISPLDVLLTAMRFAWDKGDHKDAASYAKEAAPYVHPRLASSNVSVNDKRNIADLSTAELAAILDEERGSREGADAPKAVEGQPDCIH